MKNWSSVRAVYLLILFVIIMLDIGVWTKFYPSKWLLEKLGLKKCHL